jgi:hypothetical protein
MDIVAVDLANPAAELALSCVVRVNLDLRFVVDD